jgi:DNA-binding beta-propeller fold protein YncE
VRTALRCKTKFALCISLSALLVLVLTAPAIGRQASGSADFKPLVLTDAIPVPGVKGRFDHFATGGKFLFVSALANNSLEVIDIGERALAHTIIGISHPQGIVFSPEANKLFVASDAGKLFIYDGTSFALISTIDFYGDADNLRYDPENKRVYVGYGEDQDGAIGTVDATTNQRTSEDYKLGAHPESFQLEKSGPNIYVNLPDSKQIAMINRTTHAVTRWPVTFGLNFPMALDESGHRLFVGTREPPKVAVFDTASGKLVSSFARVQDSDDLYYDSAPKRVYMSGGEGFIYVFQQNDSGQFQLAAQIPTALGARNSGYFGRGKKGFDRFYLAVPARSDHPAEIWFYTVQD